MATKVFETCKRDGGAISGYQRKRIEEAHEEIFQKYTKLPREELLSRLNKHKNYLRGED